MKNFNVGGFGGQISIKYFNMCFFSPPDSPITCLVLQQDPNIENVGLISEGELLHTATMLFYWCRTALITRRVCAKPTEVREY